jgi:hypothetical protein
MAIICAPIWFLASLLTVALFGCSAADHTYPRNVSDKVTPLSASSVADLSSGDAERPGSVTGVWQGVSHADCGMVTMANPGRCGATQNIVLTMMQQGQSVSGFYKCAFGNEVCRNLDESGVIRDGKMNNGRLFMRVMLEDGSMCFFTGRPVQGVIEGRYSCLQGAGLIERGAFRTERRF